MEFAKTKGVARLEARDFAELLARICVERALDPLDVMGRRRWPALVRAREDLMFDLRERGIALEEIGRLTDRHHTTVLHHLRMREVRARECA